MSVPVVEYRADTSTAADIEAHLAACAPLFDPPLTSRVDLKAYALKLATHAARFEAWSNGQLISLVASYCNDAQRQQAFVTSVSTLPDFSGHGIARRLMLDCLRHTQALGFQALRLEVSVRSAPAISLYSRLGFKFLPGQTGVEQHMELTLR